MRSFNLPEMKAEEKPAMASMVIPLVDDNKVMIKAKPYKLDKMTRPLEYATIGSENSNPMSASSPKQSDSNQWLRE